MTAIAALLIDNFPIILSDSLTSSNYVESDEFILPTSIFDNSIFEQNEKRRPSELCQKTIIINKFLVFSWAGKMVFAALAIKILREKMPEYSDVSEETFNQVFQILKAEAGDSNSFIFSGFCEKASRLTIKNHGTFNFPLDDENYMMTAGTGAYDLAKIVEKVNKNKYMIGQLDMHRAPAYGALVASYLLEQETSSHSSSRALYGGAWEITYFTPHGFKKLDNLTVFFAIVDFNGEYYDFSPSTMHCTKFKHDTLFARSILFREGAPFLYHAYASEPAVYRDFPNSEMEIEMPSSNLCCVLMYYPKEGTTPLVSYHLEMSRVKDDSLIKQLVIDGLKVSINFNSKTIDKCVLELKKYAEELDVI